MRHQHQHGQQNTARFPHLEQAHVKSKHLAQAPSAHHAQHGRGAYIVFPAVQGVASELRQDLRQSRVPKNFGLCDTAATQRKRRASARVFNAFSKQAAQHA